jgi:hypothetical protein
MRPSARQFLVRAPVHPAAVVVGADIRALPVDVLAIRHGWLLSHCILAQGIARRSRRTFRRRADDLKGKTIGPAMVGGMPGVWAGPIGAARDRQASRLSDSLKTRHQKASSEPGRKFSTAEAKTAVRLNCRFSRHAALRICL